MPHIDVVLKRTAFAIDGVKRIRMLLLEIGDEMEAALDEIDGCSRAGHIHCCCINIGDRVRRWNEMLDKVSGRAGRIASETEDES